MIFFSQIQNRVMLVLGAVLRLMMNLINQILTIHIHFHFYKRITRTHFPFRYSFFSSRAHTPPFFALILPVRLSVCLYLL